MKEKTVRKQRILPTVARAISSGEVCLAITCTLAYAWRLHADCSCSSFIGWPVYRSSILLVEREAVHRSAVGVHHSAVGVHRYRSFVALSRLRRLEDGLLFEPMSCQWLRAVWNVGSFGKIDTSNLTLILARCRYCQLIQRVHERLVAPVTAGWFNGRTKLNTLLHLSLEKQTAILLTT